MSRGCDGDGESGPTPPPPPPPNGFMLPAMLLLVELGLDRAGGAALVLVEAVLVLVITISEEEVEEQDDDPLLVIAAVVEEACGVWNAQSKSVQLKLNNLVSIASRPFSCGASFQATYCIPGAQSMHVSLLAQQQALIWAVRC